MGNTHSLVVSFDSIGNISVDCLSDESEASSMADLVLSCFSVTERVKEEGMASTQSQTVKVSLRLRALLVAQSRTLLLCEIWDSISKIRKKSTIGSITYLLYRKTCTFISMYLSLLKLGIWLVPLYLLLSTNYMKQTKTNNNLILLVLTSVTCICKAWLSFLNPLCLMVLWSKNY